MSHWCRTAAMAAALGLALAGPASAQSPVDRADELNEEGKDLYRKGDLPAAADKFRQAIVLSPEARFYYNLCAMLEEMGRLGEAVTACEAVAKNGASQALQDKTADRLAGIRKKLAERAGPPAKVEPPEPGPGPGEPDAGAGDPEPGGPSSPPPRPPPSYPPAGEVTRPGGPHAYKWAVGAELGPLWNRGVGRTGVFAKGGVQFKGHVDFILSDSARLGVQGYAHLATLGAGSELALYDERLAIFDVGGAIYQHRPLSARWYYTPLVGAHFTGLEAGDFGDSFVSFGFRAEVGFHWVIGRRSALSITPMLNAYLPARASADGLAPQDYGLERAGTTAALTLGYTYRFTLPFGSAPFIVLE